jgi:ankyrin repeat protein
MRAAMNGHLEVVKLLLAAGACTVDRDNVSANNNGLSLHRRVLFTRFIFLDGRRDILRETTL